MNEIRESIIKRGQDGEIEGHDPSKFSLDKPTAAIRQTGAGGAGTRPSTEAPQEDIEEFRLIADTDPHVNEAVDTLVDYLVGSGFSVTPANIPGTDQEQTDEDISDLKKLIETSSFESVLHDWVWHALVDGTGFLEIVVEEDQFKPKVLPTEDVEIVTDEFGDVEEYIFHADDEIPFEPYDLAQLSFHKHPHEDFGHSVLESAREQANMLRDMEIDYARFIATKAYPPILWKLGSEERPWTQDQIDGWLEELENIEPESQLAVGHDVEHDVVGVSSGIQGGGALDLNDTFNHLQERIAAAIGVPVFLLNMGISEGSGAAQVVMPKFDRRVQRYRARIREVVRHQMFVSILGEQNPEEYDEVPPEFEFGTHSSEEQRLDADMVIKLLNNGLLNPKAAARMLDIDPETDLPEMWDLEGDNLLEILQQLSGNGDTIQNPEGGSPTDTGGGADSSGGEVTTREKPHSGNNEDGRNQQAATEE